MRGRRKAAFASVSKGSNCVKTKRDFRKWAIKVIQSQNPRFHTTYVNTGPKL